ncbi:MAG: NUDIX domain-containing protein [Erysipelotrichaceae bacterium]|nr:NUDIX domain-containing protein [Erysipelotrichaceae bacterium]
MLLQLKGCGILISKVYPVGQLQTYKYVVVLSQYQGKILLSRHKDRTTWETQGGHIEEGEIPLEAAKRELYEESGAIDYDIVPLCDYWAGSEDQSHGANGMVFQAIIHQLDSIPDSEMAEVKTFNTLPDNLTYPAITPILFAYLKEHRDSYMKEKFTNLYNKDNNSAYQTLLELEMITTESNELYVFFDELLEMLNHSKTMIRVRGFRLICCLAKWDTENKINQNIEVILKELEDEKGTSVRQCLAALNGILLYKYELSEMIANKLKELDLSKYKESMQPLIKKDIDHILNYM